MARSSRPTDLELLRFCAVSVMVVLFAAAGCARSPERAPLEWEVGATEFDVPMSAPSLTIEAFCDGGGLRLSTSWEQVNATFVYSDSLVLEPQLPGFPAAAVAALTCNAAHPDSDEDCRNAADPMRREPPGQSSRRPPRIPTVERTSVIGSVTAQRTPAPGVALTVDGTELLTDERGELHLMAVSDPVVVSADGRVWIFDCAIGGARMARDPAHNSNESEP